jgi:hypothetical protein
LRNLGIGICEICEICGWAAGDVIIKEKRMEIIAKALEQGRTTLSEYESKQVLSAYGIPVTR